MKPYDRIELRAAVPEMPERYACSVQEALLQLPAREARRAKGGRRLTKKALAALIAAAVLLATGTALAIGYVLQMRGSSISYFEHAGGAEMAARQDYYERQSDAVDAVLGEDGLGASVLVNNIAVNGGNVSVFYTATVHESVPENADSPTLAALLPQTWIAVDGGKRRSHWSAGAKATAKRAGEHTIVWMETYQLEGGVPTVCTLTVGADAFSGAGAWETAFALDLTELAANTRVAMGVPVIHIDGTGSLLRWPYFDHDVTVKRVTIGKNGGEAVLGEWCPKDVRVQDMQGANPYWTWRNDYDAGYLAHSDALLAMTPAEQDAWFAAYDAANPCPVESDFPNGAPEFAPFVNIAIVNDRGESLNAKLPGGYSGSWKHVEVENTLYFSADFGTKYIRLIPIIGTEKETREVKIDLAALNVPVPCYEGFTVTMTEVVRDQARSELTLRFIEKGVKNVDATIGTICFTGADGERLTDLGSTMSADDPFRDDATGVTTQVVTFLDGCDLSRIHGAIFFYIVPILDEARAATVYFE